MNRGIRHFLAWLIGLSAVAVVVYMGVADSGPDMDEKSYRAGYHAFGDAWLPPSEDDRDVDKAYCEELWGKFPSDELDGLSKHDWVEGCADYREGKDAQF
ncbi:hypothetical protein DMB38_19920 [Streptomyces sp. WAC 06738]|uniref:hypothetical protein n=1 Tax=Streptomyces sp. WAC 06738 TaxID=2203210 RepID=UPI000F6C37D9|nr:hypothetical protein [Streptomyces sp. WAC 06738]AZM47745.1 hypothetical protein DMB38_19920 [Streptomyces sp. WAC 06738]